MDKEQLNELEISKPINRAFTINKKSQLKSKPTMAEKELDKRTKEVEEKTKNLDVRVKDEIDELKKIFYKFFVGSTENDLNENRNKSLSRGDTRQ